MGDVGPSAPQHWVPVFTDPGLHLVVSLFGQSSGAVERATGDLLAAIAPGVTKLCRLDGALLGERGDRFGYVDGSSQPSIRSAPTTGFP